MNAPDRMRRLNRDLPTNAAAFGALVAIIAAAVVMAQALFADVAPGMRRLQPGYWLLLAAAAIPSWVIIGYSARSRRVIPHALWLAPFAALAALLWSSSRGELTPLLAILAGVAVLAALAGAWGWPRSLLRREGRDRV